MRSKTCRLTLQSLEDRRCPTGSILHVGQTLIVRGDDSDNTIVIQDRGPGFDSQTGQPTPGTVTVTIDGQTQAFENGVQRVVVFALGGNDSVSYQPDPTGGGTEGLTSLLVDLGAGNNVADFTVTRKTAISQQGTIPAAGLNLQVFGGAGNDTVSVEVFELDGADVYVHARLGDGTNTFIGTVAGPLEHTNSPISNTLLFDVRGGAGTDSIDLEAAGVSAASYRLLASLRGGAGDDNIAADVELVGNQSSIVDLTLDGGAGDDALSATVNNETPPNFIPDRIRLIGGSGDDAIFEKFTRSAHDTNLITDGGAGADSLFFLVHPDNTKTSKIGQVITSVEEVSTFYF